MSVKYFLTIFLSSFLLFIIQPIIGKQLLPLFSGGGAGGASPVAGTASTGSGGGAGQYNGNGAAGGSGIVIVKYQFQ